MKRTDWTTFDQALASIRARAGITDKGRDAARENAKKTTQLGTDFEKMIVEYLKHDSIYGPQFAKVKRWYDWYQEPDTGIDIIARDSKGDLVGIQCKCWADDTVLDLKDISTMFTTAKAKNIDKLMLVFTGDALTTHTQKKCDEAKVRIITRADLRASRFDWSATSRGKRTAPGSRDLWPHQKEAVAKTISKFKDADRGQLIMACGTGKTLTSLHIAEKMAGVGGLVLYLVPSISLIPQTMREWADNRSVPHRYIAVCSDHTAGNDEQGSITEIPITPSTDVKTLQREYESLERKSMNVVFSTYNSVEVASEALLKHDKDGAFDLVLFDEAHKTTGLERVNESYYLLAHHNPSPGKPGVPAKKRLYMTATPRVYKRTASVNGSNRKKKNGTQQEPLQVYSMDKPHVYGDEFYKLEFSDAVSRKLLSKYKIIMREVNKGDLYGRFIESGRDDDRDAANDYGDIDMDYLAKLGGVCKAVTYPDGDGSPPRPLQRVMVFHNLIKKSKIFAAHGLNMDKDGKPLKLDKTTKKALSFDNVSKRLMSTDPDLDGIITKTRHVDGATNSRNRGMRIDWLRDSDTDPKEIRVLSNARCLQEGVDVPALDAVAFMDPKKSPIDIIQSIGRVMRKQSGKDCGYVIIPIPVLEGDNPKHALDRNKKYEQINEILQAILAHDDCLRNILNNQMLVMTSASKKRKPADQQELTPQLREWIANTIEGDISDELLEEIKTVLLELGDASYYKRVGEELGEQSVVIEEMIRQRVKKQPETAKIIDALHKNLQVVVGSAMTQQDAIKALAQHAVMDRVFTELFPQYRNPVAAALNTVLDKLGVRNQLRSLEKYYLKIKHDIEQFREPEAKQEFIRIIYDSFFRGADRKAADKHGIVYTPTEIVDFIINSVQHVLKTEFGKSFDDRCVKVHDPFTGTGIFISRLLESGMISGGQMHAKYKNDIYASEIMLPAYYVAMANISSSYQKMKNGSGRGRQAQFEDVALMDTFDQHPQYRLDARFRQKQTQLTDSNFEEARERKRKQGMDSIDVIMTNPPYSGGQKTANEDNKNVSHADLENRIDSTYGEKIPENIHQKRAIKNSYVKALRWASDRIGDSGIIGMITPSAYITGNAEAGIRSCLKEEFTDVYCLDLLSQKGAPGHGRSVFEYPGDSEGGTTVGVAITVLVKNPNKQQHDIHYYKLPESEYSGDQKRQHISVNQAA
ncbi:MAG: DEAD/DEAH box helicase family protein [Thaumarchaeota archaeon]|nr:DEAD/DEAH box helicase family protein [Nitrososphaerota archaeon]